MRLPIDTKHVQCDRCGKKLAIGGLRLQTVTEGEAEVRYFACPYCGAKFHAGTTDERQRALYAQRKQWQKKLEVGLQKGFTKKTIQRYRREMNKADQEAKGRREELAALGESILNGETREA
ncbi:MAG: hypothetical protein LUG45_05270 [Clostridiales bacterium]|nr:hypothetical protein [Clostridiales bacterium]